MRWGVAAIVLVGCGPTFECVDGGGLCAMEWTAAHPGGDCTGDWLPDSDDNDSSTYEAFGRLQPPEFDRGSCEATVTETLSYTTYTFRWIQTAPEGAEFAVTMEISGRCTYEGICTLVEEP